MMRISDQRCRRAFGSTLEFVLYRLKLNKRNPEMKLELSDYGWVPRLVPDMINSDLSYI